MQSEAGIRKQYSDTIAEALKEMAKAQPELVAAAERAAAEREAQKEQEAALGGEDGMVTLALEGNISAGKSTFLDVLSHEDTCLHDILKVGAEAAAWLAGALTGWLTGWWADWWAVGLAGWVRVAAADFGGVA